MKELIKKILKEELLTEASGTFNKSMAVEITDNVLAYPEGKTEKTYDYLGVVKDEVKNLTNKEKKQYENTYKNLK